MRKTAIVSDCGVYRYSLGREWDAALPRLGVVMLNPSTADAQSDDPTIRKVVEFAKRLGFGGIEVVNLFAFRATDPKDLWAYVKANTWVHAVGPENDRALVRAALQCGTFLLAWGSQDNRGKVKQWRAQQVRARLAQMGAKTIVLQTNADGSPKHPLYVPYAALEALNAEVQG